MVKSFSIEKREKKQFHFGWNNFVYTLFLILFFCIFVLFSGIISLLFSHSKIDFFMKEPAQISTYFLPIDSEISQKILMVDDVIKAYLSWENVLQTKKKEIFDSWEFITRKKDYLLKLGFSNYEPLLNFLADAYDYREEIFFLLGENQPFNYLILLENENEKRPNWWFFGSFAFVKIEGAHIKELQVIDSYLPDYIAPKAVLELPEWFQNLYHRKTVGFIAGNKFWFTDKDGKNIKMLFENVFNRDFEPKKVAEMFEPEKWDMLHNQFIKGVIFLKSSLLSDLIPWFEEKTRERQFTNASVDLIRGEKKSNKKEMYLKDVVQYYETHAKEIFKNLINNWDRIVKKKYIQGYFSNITEEFRSFIKNQWFSTVFSKDKIFFWNINIANNKSDGFVTKNIQLFDEDNMFLMSTQDDTLDISSLAPWKYSLVIDYDLNVPEKYFKFIHSMEEKYGITLWERENSILVMTWTSMDYKVFWWKTKEILYFPTTIKIDAIEWDYQNMQKGFTDEGKSLIYETSIEKNNTMTQVKIFFTLS